MTSWLAVAASCALVAVAARVVDVLLLSRDETLAGSSVRALELAGLQSGGLLRRRYAFATDAELLSCTPPPPADAVPLFTCGGRWPAVRCDASHSSSRAGFDSSTSWWAIRRQRGRQRRRG